MAGRKRPASRPKYPPGYRRALSGREPAETVLRAPVGSHEPSSIGEIEERLRRSGIACASGEVPPAAERRVPRAVVEVVMTLTDGLAVRIAARPATNELPEGELDWSRLTKPEIDAANASTWTVVTMGTLRRGSVLRDFHQMLKVTAAVAPDAIAVMDQSSFRSHPARWLQDAASSRVPPSPTSLYTIHSVYDDKAPESAGIWMHTHGLLRCGTIELEMAELPRDGASSMGTLLNAVAPMFIERKPPEKGEPFLAGRGIELVWLPWEESVPLLDAGALGGPQDRNPDHAAPSGLLFAPGDGESHFRSPAVHLENLDHNPVLYISDMETERMSLLSQERLPSFLALLAEHARSPGWKFLVKLGYAIDDAESATDREHLWFDVHGAKDGQVDATLLNEPYHIARLHEGQRGWHPLAKLSGWSILSPRGRFGPDTVRDLERRFDKPTNLN